MARSMWSGAISFGLVNVPIKLYSAVSRKTVRFHQLSADDGARIQQKRVSSVSGDEVPYERIVKGYELSPDRYVTITQEELDSLDPKSSRMIEIQDFVDLADIDPVYYDHSYYLAPATGASKPYELLREAMTESGKVAIATFVMRGKEYLAAIRASGPALVLSTMVFADEVVPADQIDELMALEDVEASDREVKMAQQLIDSLSGDFEPEKYRDRHREQVMEMIEKKAAGEEIVVQPAPEQPKAVPDLMAALEASIAAVKDKGGSGDGAASNGKESAAARKPAAAKKPAAKKKPAARKPAAKKSPASKS